MERANRTLEDRLVNELPLRRIRGLAAANPYLRRHSPPPNTTSGSDSLLRIFENLFVAPDGEDLKRIFSLEGSRSVTNDDAVRMNRVCVQLGPRAGRQAGAELRVRVRRHMDGNPLGLA